MQRTGEIVNDVFAFFKKQGTTQLTIPLLSAKLDKSEKEEKPSDPVVTKSNSQKMFSLKDLLCDDDFDQQGEQEFAEICSQPEKWTSCNPPIVTDFLASRLAAYKKRLEAAVRIQTEIESLLEHNANHIAIKTLLNERIKSLKRIIVDYKDSLDERSIALRPLELEGFLPFKIKSNMSDFKPCESFSDAIFLCHYSPALALLSMQELALIVEKHGRCGVNGIAGRELCKLINVELIRRLNANEIMFDDANLNRIKGYLSHWITDLNLQLNDGLTQHLCGLLDLNVVSPADQRLHVLLFLFKREGLPSHQKLCQAIRDAAIKLIHTGEIDIFGEPFEKIFTCLENTSSHSAVAKTVTSLVISRLQERKIDPQDSANSLNQLLLMFKDTEHVCYENLKSSIAVHLNAKATAFRKVYQLLFSLINNPFKSNFLHNKDAMPPGLFLDEVRHNIARNPLVAFVWNLLQEHYPNISEHNKKLFKQLYKAKVTFSYLNLSRIAGTLFMTSTNKFNNAVDALTDKEIDDYNNSESTSCRAMIYRGLKC